MLLTMAGRLSVESRGEDQAFCFTGGCEASSGEATLGLGDVGWDAEERSGPGCQLGSPQRTGAMEGRRMGEITTGVREREEDGEPSVKSLGRRSKGDRGAALL